MILETLGIQNFMSIRNIQLKLNDRGLVLIQGENLDNENFDNNGSGKSSITEALVYVLYGRTIRGLKGDDVVHNVPNRNCKVWLDIIDDDESRYRIIRYRKHREHKNSSYIYKNGKNITPRSEKEVNEFIVNLLQMDFLTFTSSLLYSEQSFKFTSATDAEMKSAFDTMLGFEVLTRCQDVAKDTVKSLSTNLEIKNAELTNLNTLVETHVEQIQVLTEKEKSYRDTVNKKVQELTEELNEVTEELQEHMSNQRDNKEILEDLVKLSDKVLEKLDEYKAWEEDLNQLKIEINNLNTQVSTQNNLINKSKSQKLKLNQKIEKVDSKIQNVQNSIEEIKKTVGTPCPTCGEPLSQDKIQNAIETLNNKITELEGEKQEYEQEIEELLNDMEVSEGLIQSYNTEASNLKELMTKTQEILKGKISWEKQYKTVQNEIAQITAEQIQHEKIKSQYEKRIDSIKSSIQEYENSKDNMYKSIIEQTVEELETAKKTLVQKQQEITQIKSEIELYEFWVAGFGNQGIKSHLLTDVTPFLNRRVNKYLQKLTSNSIEVVFNTQTILKNGETREKFSLNINNTNGGKSYISNSGGERKRIDVAVNMALQDLVAARSNKKLNIVFYDEVFDALDNVGCECVIELLQEVSKDKSSVFVITHNDNLKSYFNNSITVVKKNKFSSLKE